MVVYNHYIGAISLDLSNSSLKFDYINMSSFDIVNYNILVVLHKSHMVPSFGEEIHQTGISMVPIAWNVKLGGYQ